MDKPEKLEKLKSNLILLKNELEVEDLNRLAFHFDRMDNLSPTTLDDITIKELRAYFDKLNNYYINLYNVSNRKKMNI